MTEQNFAIVRTATGKAELRSVPLPDLPDDYILVKTAAVAMNPTDWTTLDAKGDAGTVVGVDYAGVVEKVGPAVSRDFTKGDRIAGISQGGGSRSTDC
jgi:NADPH:quinone reductase-like Zn-dependent oxidoreductase